MQKIFPFPALANLLVSIIAFFVIIIYGSSILMPIAISIMLALTIHPLVEYLGKKQFRKKPLFSKSGAILCAIFIVVLFLAAAIILAGSQITKLAADMPNLTEKFNTLLLNIQDMVEQYFGIAPEEQFQLVNNGLNQFFSTGASMVGTTVNAASSIFFYLSIVPFYVFLMLFYAERFQDFLLEMVPKEQRDNTLHISNNLKKVVNQYVVSLLSVIGIVAILNCVGFLLVGINYAIFFGILISSLAIIPYFGILIGAVLAAVYALLTTDSLWYPAGVIIVNSIVQFLEGNFITPYIMGSRLSLNPLAIIIFLSIGGWAWGALGMIISVPLLAITKMVCDNVESLHPYGRLLEG